MRKPDHLTIGLVLGPLGNHRCAHRDVVGVAKEITHDPDMGGLIESNEHDGVGHR
jgi:hypothetical protein